MSYADRLVLALIVAPALVLTARALWHNRRSS